MNAGAFTGADSRRQGRFELADGGTIFLDEIGDMSLKAQAKVLRVIETGEVERLGGNQIRTVDVRIIAATNKHLPEEIEKGLFRRDLFYRLNVVPITVPPLRERMEDVPLLVQYFAERLQLNMASTPKVIDPGAYAVFQGYSWPGNIRELKNIVERLLIMVNRDVVMAPDVVEALSLVSQPSLSNNASGVVLDPSVLQSTLGTSLYKPGTALSQMMDSAEAQCILAALEENKWNIRKTAEALEVERSNLYKKNEQVWYFSSEFWQLKRCGTSDYRPLRSIWTDNATEKHQRKRWDDLASAAYPYCHSSRDWCTHFSTLVGIS